MTIQTKVWDGNEWQKHSLLLLKNHYRLGDFQEVPDGVKGDFGIEGFSTDGCVYQCYASQEYHDATKLYEDQRNKITRDLKKFVDNRADLGKLFNGIKVKRWILMVPTFDDKRLTLHAAAKAQEICSIQPPLPYVDDNFRVLIVNDDHFALTRESLVQTNSLKMQMSVSEIEPYALDEWLASPEHFGPVRTLEKKGAKLGYADKEMLASFRDGMLKHFLKGQNALHNLQTNYPDMFEQCTALKMQREEQLEILSQLALDPPKKGAKRGDRHIQEHATERRPWSRNIRSQFADLGSRG